MWGASWSCPCIFGQDHWHLHSQQAPNMPHHVTCKIPLCPSLCQPRFHPSSCKQPKFIHCPSTLDLALSSNDLDLPLRAMATGRVPGISHPHLHAGSCPHLGSRNKTSTRGADSKFSPACDITKVRRKPNARGSSCYGGGMNPHRPCHIPVHMCIYDHLLTPGPSSNSAPLP